MKHICFYFQVHQPYRLKNLTLFNLSGNAELFDEESNKKILEKVSASCYLPANKLLLKLLKQYPEFKLAFSLSGTFVDQIEQYTPSVLNSFQELFQHPAVELLAETFSHGLAFRDGKEAFQEQVALHGQKVLKHFNKRPKILRNTELIYSNTIGSWAHEMGFDAMLAEGADKILNGLTPNQLYHHPTQRSLKLLLKNYRLSDDIAFRFSDRRSGHWPLTAEKFIDWIAQYPDTDQLINLFLDYETFGEHQWQDTGIFKFLEYLPKAVNKNKSITFFMPGEAILNLPSTGPISVPVPLSWADQERDISAWLGNDMQFEAFTFLISLKEKVEQSKSRVFNKTWLYLQTSDHFYYMSTKTMEDGSVHAYFSPYDSPHDAFTNYMNALTSFERQLNNYLNKMLK